MKIGAGIRGLAGLDPEAGIAAGRLCRPAEAVDASQRRVACGELGQEPVEVLGLSLDLDQDAAGRILDEAVQAQVGREPVDEGPKTNALHDPTDGNRPTVHAIRSALVGWDGTELGAHFVRPRFSPYGSTLYAE